MDGQERQEERGKREKGKKVKWEEGEASQTDFPFRPFPFSPFPPPVSPSCLLIRASPESEIDLNRLATEFGEERRDAFDDGRVRQPVGRDEAVAVENVARVVVQRRAPEV